MSTKSAADQFFFYNLEKIKTGQGEQLLEQYLNFPGTRTRVLREIVEFSYLLMFDNKEPIFKGALDSFTKRRQHCKPELFKKEDDYKGYLLYLFGAINPELDEINKITSKLRQAYK